MPTSAKQKAARAAFTKMVKGKSSKKAKKGK